MSISKEKNNGERYKVQVTLQRRTFYMGYYSTYEEAVAMIQLGVKRIGTSGAKAIADGQATDAGY